MPDFEKPPQPGGDDNKVVDFGKKKIEKLEEAGELDKAREQAGNELDYYEKRKQEGKETFGKWSYFIVDSKGEVIHLIGQDESKSFKLHANDAEGVRQEHNFASDKQAEAALQDIKKQFPEIEAQGLEFRLMGGSLDEEQPDEEKTKPTLRLVKDKEPEN